MAKIVRMVPKGGPTAKETVQEFLDAWGDKIHSVVIIARAKDGATIDGWSKECVEDIRATLGMIEETKLDFWNTMFETRVDRDD
jgi:hypothetical protein